MSRFVVVSPDFAGDQILALVRDTVTGIERYRSVSGVMRSTVINELSPEDVEYISGLRSLQDGCGRGDG
jgi:hypothetical protein